MSSMPMHVMTIVAGLALLTVAFVMSYKKKSKSESEEDYQTTNLPPGFMYNRKGQLVFIGGTTGGPTVK